MTRAIISFHQDERGDWVADLECGHGQHVRHQPPWSERPWVLTAGGRAGRIGSHLRCARCEEEGGAEGSPSPGDIPVTGDRITHEG